MAKNLILYFSRAGENFDNGKIKSIERGNAELITEYVRKAVGADIFEIEPAQPYPMDYMVCTEIAQDELETQARPPLKRYLNDISGYENIFVIGPCWWGTYPMAMYTQLEMLDFEGKNLFLAMTHEGDGLGETEELLRERLAGARFGESIEIEGSAARWSETRVSEWAKICVNY